MSTATLELEEISKDVDVEIPDVFSKCLCLSLTIKQFGLSKPLDASEYNVDAEKERTKAVKRLLVAPEIDAIGQAITDLRQIVYRIYVPSPLKAGTYMIPLVSVRELDNALRAQTEIVRLLIDQAANALPRIIEDDREALQGVFDPGNYPSADKFRAAYSIKWKLFSFGGPDALKQIDMKLYERNAREFAETIREGAEEIRTLLRIQMAKLVNTMVERLSGGRSGKPKIFRDTLVSNMEEFLNSFSARNLTEDGALQKLVADAKSLLRGVDPETLRKSEDIRQTVADGMARVKEQLDTMLVDKPERAISFDD